MAKVHETQVFSFSTQIFFCLCLSCCLWYILPTRYVCVVSEGVSLRKVGKSECCSVNGIADRHWIEELAIHHGRSFASTKAVRQALMFGPAGGANIDFGFVGRWRALVASWRGRAMYTGV